MSKKDAPPPIETLPTASSKQQPKKPEKKGLNPEDYVTLTIPLE